MEISNLTADSGGDSGNERKRLNECGCVGDGKVCVCVWGGGCSLSVQLVQNVKQQFLPESDQD